MTVSPASSSSGQYQHPPQQWVQQYQPQQVPASLPSPFPSAHVQLTRLIGAATYHTPPSPAASARGNSGKALPRMSLCCIDRHNNEKCFFVIGPQARRCPQRDYTNHTHRNKPGRRFYEPHPHGVRRCHFTDYPFVCVCRPLASPRSFLFLSKEAFTCSTPRRSGGGRIRTCTRRRAMYTRIPKPRTGIATLPGVCRSIPPLIGTYTTTTATSVTSMSPVPMRYTRGLVTLPGEGRTSKRLHRARFASPPGLSISAMTPEVGTTGGLWYFERCQQPLPCRLS